MEITGVECIALQRSFMVVRIHTDAGIVGYGEISPMNARVIRSLIEEELAPRLIGSDPFEIEGIWERSLHEPYKLGPRGVQLYGISAVDIALWDILGKASGLPIYQLLGGRCRERVPLYASFLRRDCSPEDQAQAAREMVDAGYTAVKIRIGRPWGFDVEEAWSVEMIRKTREAIGPDADLLVDANCAFTVPAALRMGRVLEDHGAFHFEEPIAEYDLEGTRELARALDVPVACGEQRYTRWDFLELITRGEVDIIQPDIVKSGGFTETKKIAALGSAFGRPCTLHCSQPTIGFVATLHFAVSEPWCRYPQEHLIEPHPVGDRIFRNPPRIVDGSVEVPEGPGLGVEIDEEVLEELAD